MFLKINIVDSLCYSILSILKEECVANFDRPIDSFAMVPTSLAKLPLSLDNNSEFISFVSHMLNSLEYRFGIPMNTEPVRYSNQCMLNLFINAMLFDLLLIFNETQTLYIFNLLNYQVRNQ